jgi:hypothetical protein
MLKTKTRAHGAQRLHDYRRQMRVPSREIQLFGGWNDNGRDLQKYQVSYSLVGSSAFTPLGSLEFSSQAAGGLPSAVWGAFDTTLTGVDGVRIDFPTGQEAGYSGLGEVDVVGVASVPEPASAMLGLLAGGALIARRRRQSR